MSYQQEYQRWLRSGALSQAEKAELEAIAQEPQEIEDRFFGLLEFGTAGLRGVMGVGLRRSERPCDPPRHPGLCPGDPGGGAGGRCPGGGHLLRLPGPLPGIRPGGRRGDGGQRHPRAAVPGHAAHPGTLLCRAGVRLHRRAQRHRQPQPAGVQRLQGLLAGRRPAPPHHAEAIAKKMEELDFFASSSAWTTTRRWRRA